MKPPRNVLARNSCRNSYYRRCDFAFDIAITLFARIRSGMRRYGYPHGPSYFSIPSDLNNTPTREVVQLRIIIAIAFLIRGLRGFRIQLFSRYLISDLL